MCVLLYGYYGGLCVCLLGLLLKSFTSILILNVRFDPQVRVNNQGIPGGCVTGRSEHGRQEMTR